MATLTPTPVDLQDLMNSASDINLFNDGIKTQAASPRTRTVEAITVQVKDDPNAPSLATGTADTNTVNTLTDTAATFVTDGVVVGDTAVNTDNQDSAVITAVTETVITMGTDDIFPAGTENYKVLPATFYTQHDGLGEWKRSNSRLGNDEIISYTFPTAGTASSALVHTIVYPVANPNNTGIYPPTGWKS